MSDVVLQGCDAVQQAHPDWLVLHSSRSGLWSAYRRFLPGRPGLGDVLLVRAGSVDELERKLSARVSPTVPPSIRAIAVARALRTPTARVVPAVRPGQAVVASRSTALRRLLRS
ncbi:hypothetical protein ABZ470_36775 [Streptosporangium sp. NPDC020072]|uniref:hypothetical protein n=1 Tax=Streptosporangium sp. NPDC020072 TaxID=3154788 RepID=UPI0034436958